MLGRLLDWFADLSDGWQYGIMGLILAGLVALGVWARVVAIRNCEVQGGVYHCTTSQGTTVDHKGRVGTVSEETCDCYTPDGRVLLKGAPDGG